MLEARRRGAMKVSAARFLLAVTIVGCVSCRSGPAYHNLVLVTIDTLRADHLGLYGYPRSTSPFLDDLGREGVVFWRAIAASSHTAPSHATILTSLYPEQHQVLVNGQDLLPEVRSLADISHDADLDSAAFVSVEFLEGLARGFAMVDAVVPAESSFRTADTTVDHAVKWLRSRDRGRRFVLWVHVYDPHQHHPTTHMPEPYYKRMREDAERRGEGFLAFLREEHGYHGGQVSDNINRYDAQIAFVDDELRRLFEAVATSAASSRTLSIITADHGQGLGSHGFEGHGRHLYNEQVRVPLIIHGDPARLHRGVVKGLVRHVDILPTVAELLGIRVSGEELRLEGRSLAPLLESPGMDIGIETAFSQRRPADLRRLELGWEPGVVLAAQDARYKYIYRSEGTDEFYDLRLDPRELWNLIKKPSPDKDRLRMWLLEEFESLAKDRRTKGATPDIDPRHIEALKALGYI